jgi:hypothetical protein
MFELREDHLTAFRNTAAANFEDRAVAHLRKELPDQTAGLTDDDLRRRIRSSMNRGRQYGLTSERQLMRFVDADFLLGDSFEVDPQQSWSAAILRDPDYSADERSALLLAAAEGVAAHRKAPGR